MADLFDVVVGQDRAVALLRGAARTPVHAYLFVGQPGTGKRAAAAAFASALLCPAGGCGECLRCRRTTAESDPDFIVVEREGASISTAQVDEMIRLAARSPVEGSRKVIVLVDFHLVDQQYPRLLKTLEEPPASTVFLLLAEHVPADLATIASRCVRVEFGPLAEEVLVADLVASGVGRDQARAAAAAASGRLDRARLLASDVGFGARAAAWRSVPERLDGTGTTVAALVDELLASADAVLEPLRARQAAEVEEMQERIRQYGERGAGRRNLEERHRREQRRVRADEMRFGLATLAGAYRDRVALSPSAPDAEAVRAVQAAGEAMIRNPSEPLLLTGLLCRLTNLVPDR